MISSPGLTLWGRVLTDGQEVPPRRVRLDGQRIVDVVAADRPASGDVIVERGWIAPGLIDLQVNGAGGVDLTATDDLEAVARMLAQHGVTAFCPTIVSSPRQTVLDRLAVYGRSEVPGGAASLGAHIEGPFLDADHRGVHDPAVLRDATSAEIDDWLAAGQPAIVTLASERTGGLEAIARLSEAGVTVSLGHSRADVVAARAGLQAGARMATHLFNGMPPLHHRHPGLVGALLASDATCGLIADGVHVDPLVVDLVVHRVGPERVALVSDALAAADLPPGPTRLGDQTVISDGHVVRRADGTLAGSAMLLDGCLRHARAWLPDLSPAAVIQMATQTPAAVVAALDRGRVAPGFVADLVILENDFTVRQVVLRGELLDPSGRTAVASVTRANWD